MTFIRALSILIAAVGPLVAAQPTAPTNFTATVTNNCSAVFLSWSAVSANPQVQGYKIYRTNLLDGTGVVTTLTNRLTTNWTDTAVSPVSYRYQVTAYNNTESPRSSAVTVNPCPDNTSPTVPASVVANSIGCTAASLAWSASADNTGPAYQVKSGLAAYRVYRDGDLVAEVGTPVFSDNGLDEGSTYVYRISAVDVVGNESAPSPVLSVTTTSAVPAYVEKIAVTNDVAVLTWRGTPGVKYQVLSAPGFLGPWSLVDAPTTNMSITALAVEPTASYRVARAAQLSPYKDNATNYRKDKSPPTTPTNLMVTVLSCSNVLLSWSPSVDTGTRVGNTVYTSGLAGYLIYRTNGGGGFLKRVDAQTTSTTDSTVAPSMRYTYAVVALDNAGNQSASSTPATVTTPPCANPPPCTYAIVPTGWTAPAGGGNTPVSVTAPSGCSWTVSNPCSSWVTVSPTSGSGNGSVSVSVTANTTGAQRSCTLTIAGQSFTITQPAQCTYAIAPTGWTASADGGNTAVSVTAPTGCSWTVNNPCSSWVTVSPASGSGNGSVTVSVTANTTGAQRSCTLTLAGQSFTITQPAQCTYAIAPTGWTAPAEGGSTSVSVATQSGCFWTVSNPCLSWVTVSPISGSGNGSVTITAGANTTGSSRSCVVTIAGQSFTVTQPAVCTYGLSSGSWTAPAEGGSATVTVTAPTGCSWTVNNPCSSWVTVSPASGSGNGSVTITAGDNTTGSSRSCVVTIAGQSFTVTQPAQCTYAITPTGWTAPAGGGNTSVNVTAPGGCSWTVSNPCASWVTVSPTSGSGNGSVTITAGANTTGTSRSCVVTIAGQSFTVTQPVVCTATITVDVSPAGGGTVSGGGTVNCGASVTVSATPSACYRFVNWTENGTVVSTAASYTFTANGNRDLVANFALNTYTVTTSVSPAGGGTVSGGGTVNCGTSVTVMATPNPGYVFVNWTENGTVVSAVANYSFFVGGDRHLVANFNALLPPETWPKAFPGSSYNYGRAILVDPSGDVLLAALFAGTVDFGNGLLTSAGAADMVLARYSAAGQCRWVRHFGNTGTEAPKIMALDANGNIIVAGSFSGMADVGAGPMASAGQDDIFLAKYTPAGGLLWVKQFGGAYSDVANGVAVDAEGNIVLVGTFKGSLTFGGATLYSVAMGMDTYVAKLDGRDGSHLWSKNFPNMADDQGQGVALDANGNVFITGSFGGGIDFGGGMLSAVHGYDAYVAKLSSQGAHIWSRAFGGTSGDSGKSLAVDPQGNVLVTGWFTKSVDFGGGPANLLTNLTSFYDIFLAKLQGSDGNCVWARSLSGPSYDDPVAVTSDQHGNVVLTGYFPHELNTEGVKLVATGNQDVFLAKYSPTGNLVQARSFGGLIKGYEGDYAVPSGIFVGPNAQVFGCGSFKGTLVLDGTTLTSPTNYAAWMHRFSLP